MHSDGGTRARKGVVAAAQTHTLVLYLGSEHASPCGPVVPSASTSSAYPPLIQTTPRKWVGCVWGGAGLWQRVGPCGGNLRGGPATAPGGHGLSSMIKW